MGDVVARALAKQANDKGANLSAQLAETGTKIENVSMDINLRELNGKLPFGTKLNALVGDGTTEESSTFQALVNYCYANKLTLFLPHGEFLISTPIYLPASLKIKGSNSFKNVYTATRKECKIILNNPTNKTLFVALGYSNIEFENLYFETKTPLSASGTICFGGVELNNSSISKCVFSNFGTLFACNVKGVSTIHHNSVQGIWDAFMTGDFVDSEIANNYINGRPLTNATFMRSTSIAMSRITGNFVDFFKIMFDMRFCGGLNVVGNTFDVFYKGFTTTSTNNISKITALGNTFRHNTKSVSLGYFTNADAEMRDGTWTLIDGIKGLSQFSFVGNVIDKTDLLLNIVYYPNYSIKIANNTTNEAITTFNFAPVKSATSYDLKSIFIDFMEDQTFATLPKAGQTGTVATYNRQRIVYNNKVLTNIDGVWYDAMGVAVVM